MSLPEYLAKCERLTLVCPRDYNNVKSATMIVESENFGEIPAGSTIFGNAVVENTVHPGKTRGERESYWPDTRFSANNRLRSSSRWLP